MFVLLFCLLLDYGRFFNFLYAIYYLWLVLIFIYIPYNLHILVYVSMDFSIWVPLYNNHHNQNTESEKSLLCCLVCSQHFLPSPNLATTNPFLFPIVLRFLECHVNGIIQHTTFWEWLLSFSEMHLKFSYIVDISSLFFILT